MAEEESKKVDSETPAKPLLPPPPPPLAPPPSLARAPAPEPAAEALRAVAEEKTKIPPPEEKVDESKAHAIVEKVPESVEQKPAEGSINRDAVLARVATEKRLSLIKAWEDSEKSKAENKAHKKISAIGAWENTQKANVEAELKKLEEKLEKQKAEYAEKMKNKMALIHKEAEEKRAIVEAKRGEDLLKAEEMAAKYRATGAAPKKLLGCF